MIQLKDVIHYYIGRPIYLCDDLGGNAIMKPLTLEVLAEHLDMFYEIKSIRPYILSLRRLEDMTQEERQARGKYNVIETINDVKVEWETPATFHYLLQQGFDLFGLIESRQAIDAKTLKQ